MPEIDLDTWADRSRFVTVERGSMIGTMDPYDISSIVDTAILHEPDYTAAEQCAGDDDALDEVKFRRYVMHQLKCTLRMIHRNRAYYYFPQAGQSAPSPRDENAIFVLHNELRSSFMLTLTQMVESLGGNPPQDYFEWLAGVRRPDVLRVLALEARRRTEHAFSKSITAHHGMSIPSWNKLKETTVYKLTILQPLAVTIRVPDGTGAITVLSCNIKPKNDDMVLMFDEYEVSRFKSSGNIGLGSYGVKSWLCLEYLKRISEDLSYRFTELTRTQYVSMASVCDQLDEKAKSTQKLTDTQTKQTSVALHKAMELHKIASILIVLSRNGYAPPSFSSNQLSNNRPTPVDAVAVISKALMVVDAQPGAHNKTLAGNLVTVLKGMGKNLKRMPSPVSSFFGLPAPAAQAPTPPTEVGF